MNEQYILEMKEVSKYFGGAPALEKVSFKAAKGKVNVLIGENGAGKSTLMRILAGAINKSEGEIIINGNLVDYKKPDDALKNGVVMIYQELNLVKDMTVADNIFLGVELENHGIVKQKDAVTQAQELLDEYEIGISALDKVGSLSMAKQQMIEIVKALSKSAKIIIMDEPTSSLTQREVEQLFKIVDRLKREEIAIIYISHRMEEIFEIGDYVTVLRDGRYVNEWAIPDITQELLINNMVGREITQIFPKEIVEIGDVVLKVDGLTKSKMYQDVSFELHRGEILGMAGLIGAGRTEVALSLFGYFKPDYGTVILNGEQVQFKNTNEAIKKKMAYVPEDRKLLGVNLNAKISDNISIANLDRVSKKGFMNVKQECDLCNDMVGKLRIKLKSIKQNTKELSGGNQQKVVLAKWISRDLDVLILDEPTRGVDVGAKEEIHRLIVDIAKQGVGIIMISSELPEILGMSDRVVVMHEGKITGILGAAESTQESLMRYATNTAQANN